MNSTKSGKSAKLDLKRKLDSAATAGLQFLASTGKDVLLLIAYLQMQKYLLFTDEFLHTAVSKLSMAPCSSGHDDNGRTTYFKLLPV